jgi:hypothetical protein
MSLPVGTLARLNVGGLVNVGYLWGKIGEVGATAGDVYLITPDGERYEVGSKIEVAHLPIGIEPSIGLEIGMRGRFRLFAQGGYRLNTLLGDWTYEVSDSDGERRSELPASGFQANPPDVKLTGTFFRLGVVALTTR